MKPAGKSSQGWREIGGRRVYLRSKWEANFARYLQWLKDKGQIQEWEHEPETFWFDGIRRGVCSYLPDFKVTEKAGSLTYYEVKGYMDAKSKTKLARMKKYHPAIKLVVVDEAWFRASNKTLRGLVPGWE